MEIRNEASSSYRTAAPAVPERVPGRCTVVLGNASRTFYYGLQKLLRSFLKFDWSIDSRFNMSIRQKVERTRIYDKREASLFRRGSLKFARRTTKNNAVKFTERVLTLSLSYEVLLE